MPKLEDIQNENEINQPCEQKDEMTFSDGDTERLAISLFDLNRLPSDIRAKLIKGEKLRLDLKRENVFLVDDETATTFICPLLEAAQVCDIVRHQDREAGDKPTGVYLSKGGAWAKIGADVRLTVISEGNSKLNPKIFRRVSEAKPLQPKRVY